MGEIKYKRQSGENFAEAIIEFPLSEGQPIVHLLSYDEKTITTLDKYNILIETKQEIASIKTDDEGKHTIVLSKDLVVLLARAYKFINTEPAVKK